MPDADDFAARAARRRATWTIKRLSQDDGRPPVPDDPGERIGMVQELSDTAWELSGKPLPDYTRETIPIVAIRLGKPR